MITIRMATRQDTPELVELEHVCFSHDRLSIRSIRRFISMGQASVLVLTIGEIVKGAAIITYRNNCRKARLYSLAIEPSVRHKGLGQKLLMAAVGAARQQGCCAIVLETKSSNRSASSLYERHGFVPVKHLSRYYEDGSDAIRKQAWI